MVFPRLQKRHRSSWLPPFFISSFLSLSFIFHLPPLFSALRLSGNGNNWDTVVVVLRVYVCVLLLFMSRSRILPLEANTLFAVNVWAGLYLEALIQSVSTAVNNIECNAILVDNIAHPFINPTTTVVLLFCCG